MVGARIRALKTNNRTENKYASIVCLARSRFSLSQLANSPYIYTCVRYSRVYACTLDRIAYKFAIQIFNKLILYFVL